MLNAFEQLLSETGDLLYRVRIYDRDLAYGEEIMEMDDLHAELTERHWSAETEFSKREAAEQLAAMKYRLLTLFEDLLFIA
jgi:hypothetical protein